MEYGNDWLQLSHICSALKNPQKLKLSDTAIKKIENSRKIVQNIVDSGITKYGVNTGFGPLYDTAISKEDTSLLQKNLILSHSVGVGDYIRPDLVRLMLHAKIHALAKGFSGISKEVVLLLKQCLEHDILPCIPSQGSVGASGDLAPLSHMVLPLIGEGKVLYKSEIIDSKSAFEACGLLSLELQAKEGLALINGTQFILSHALFGLNKLEYLLSLADLAAAMSLEAYAGNAKAYTKELLEVRPHEGILLSAKNIRKFLEGSEISGAADKDKIFPRVQDPYSLRCVPQVHGASYQAFLHLKMLSETELNSVTDNPIVLPDGEIISGGNFHGQPLAMALDYAALATAELGNISDRRIYLLLEGKFGLPRLLTPSPGLNSGFMIPQYTTAALVSENKSLCFPASADSIPTSLGQEDHVSMGSISGRKFVQILENLEKILAIELMIAAQGLEFRRPLKSSYLIEKNWEIIRSEVPMLQDDRLLHPDIDAMIRMVQNRNFIFN